MLARRKRRDTQGSRSEEELFGVWRDAVIEINHRRISRIMVQCRLDREKLELWAWWLHSSPAPAEGAEARSQPDLDDVWPLVEIRVSVATCPRFPAKRETDK